MGATDQLFVTHQKVLASGVPSTHGIKQRRSLFTRGRTRWYWLRRLVLFGEMSIRSGHEHSELKPSI